jgi:hypothetical protein
MPSQITTSPHHGQQSHQAARDSIGLAQPELDRLTVLHRDHTGAVVGRGQCDGLCVTGGTDQRDRQGPSGEQIQRRNQFGRELLPMGQSAVAEVAVYGLSQPDPILARGAVVPDRERESPHIDSQRFADHVQRGERADDLPRHHGPPLLRTSPDTVRDRRSYCQLNSHQQSVTDHVPQKISPRAGQLLGRIR